MFYPRLIDFEKCHIDADNLLWNDPFKIADIQHIGTFESLKNR